MSPKLLLCPSNLMTETRRVVTSKRCFNSMSTPILLEKKLPGNAKKISSPDSLPVAPLSLAVTLKLIRVLDLSSEF